MNKLSPESIAALFHETYERLAPQYGYTTREETKLFDAASANGKLMIAVCKEVGAVIYQAGMDKQRKSDAALCLNSWPMHARIFTAREVAAHCSAAIRNNKGD